MTRKLSILLFLLPLLVWSGSSVALALENVRIGILAKRGPAHTLQQWQATADYLSEQVEGYRFEIVPLDFLAITPAVANGEVDFVLANSGIYVEMETRYGVSRIATMRNLGGENGLTLFGGVIFVRKDRQDINTLEQLGDKRFAAVEANSLGGFLMARRELADLGIHPYEDTRLSFHGTHDEVVFAVLDGRADAGTVRTDTLERMSAEDKIDLEQIKVLNAQNQPGFNYRLSTRLYPEWPFAKLKHTPDDLSHAVATALLSMPPDCCAAEDAKIVGWTVPRNYQPVHRLMRELHVGPYKDLDKITIAQVLRHHWPLLLLIVLTILIMSGVIIYITSLNRRLRSTEAKLVDARDHLAERVRERTAELEESRAILERISKDWNDAFDAIDDPIFIHDAQNRIVQANPAYCRRAGVPLEHMLGQAYYAFFPKQEAPLPSCLHFPEQLSSEGDELKLDNGDIYISRSFGIRRSDGSVTHAIHILEDITAERQGQVQLSHRIAVESLLAGLAAEFVSVEPESLDEALEDALALLGQFINADRTYLFHYDRDNDLISNTHEWCAEGIVPMQENLQQIPFDELPWLKTQVLRGANVSIDDVDSLPPEASIEQAEFKRESIRSLLVTPLSYGDRPIGFIGFDFVASSHQWADLDVRLLRTAGEMIANTIGRISAVQKVRNSEASLSAAQTIAHLGNWDWNMTTGELSWSDEIYRIFGQQPREFGATYEAFLEAVHPDDRQYVIDSVSNAVAGKEDYRIDHRIIRPDGEIRIVHERGDIIRDDVGKAVRMIGAVQDVTDTRRSELEQRRLNRALLTLSHCNTALVHAADEQILVEDICRILIETGGYRLAWVGYADHDHPTHIEPVAYAGEEEKSFKRFMNTWNDETSDKTPAGYAMLRREPFISRDIASSDTHGPWRKAALERSYQSVIALPLISQGELFGALNIDATETDAFDANEVNLLEELAGDLAFGIRTLRNQEQRAHAEAALLATEQRYEELYENAPNGYLSIKAGDGSLLQYNRALCDMLGYSRTELEKMNISDLYYKHEEGLTKARHIFDDITHGKTIRDEQLLMHNKNGEPIWVSIDIDPIFDEKGQLQESRTAISDISARKRAEEEQQEVRERLQRSLLQTIKAIALTIEKRDPYTAGHQERVATLAEAIARELGMDEDRIEGLRLGALIHDIGKIAVPAEILNRPGHLDEELFAIIKTHPAVGYEIIRGIEFPWPLAEMVQQHHERLDGTGYPMGLKGDAILFEARILSVADVIEAMATHRPYRAALGMDAALNVLEEGKGDAFDPEAVEACKRLFAEKKLQWPLQ